MYIVDIHMYVWYVHVWYVCKVCTFLDIKMVFYI